MNFDRFYSELFTFLGMFVGLAALAMFLSRNSNTVGVINAGSQGVGNLLTAATNPFSQGGSTTGGPVLQFQNYGSGQGFY